MLIADLRAYVDPNAVANRPATLGARSDDLPRRIARLLVNPALTMHEFLTLVQSLRAARTPWASQGVVSVIHRWLVSASSATGPDSPRNSGDPPCIDCGTVASASQQQRASAIRQALPHLAFTDEHIRQIAFVIGYAHATELNRDFRAIFDMTPKEFRRLTRGPKMK